MSQPHSEVLANIRQYAEEVRKLHDEQMDMDAANTEARLDLTIRELQARVKEQQEALEKLRASSQTDVTTAFRASNDPREKLQQLHTVKAAYASLIPRAPYLPPKDSVLPALLAVRTLQQNIAGTKDSIASTQSALNTREATLKREQANLHDAHLLTRALESRIARLQTQQTDRVRKTPRQLAQELIEAKRAQTESYNAKTQRLTVAFHEFIADYLAPMLAAEELGGPVVGDMPDVDEAVLAAGFTQQGRAKSTKRPVPEKRRQRTIDQIWGGAAAEDDEQLDEAEAADNAFADLVEKLFATLLGPGGGRAYYEVERESAASRFLVRARIAQFHPRDARKLRLIDFGRELDD